jgi:ribosome modulation factor
VRYFRVEIPVDNILAESAEHAARIAFDACINPAHRTALVFGADEYAEAGDAPTVVDLAALDAARGARMTPSRVGFAARAVGASFDACPYRGRDEAMQWRAGWRVADASLPTG